MNREASDHARRQPRGMPGNAGQFRSKGKPDAPDLKRERSRAEAPVRRLSDDLKLFNSLIDYTRATTGLLRQQVFHDYCLIRGLNGIADALPKGGRFREAGTERALHKERTGRKPPTQGVWAFGGGTSLSSAWKISPRYSEDIDACVFMHAQASGSSFQDIRERVDSMVASAVGTQGSTSGSPIIATTRFRISDSVEVKVDHARVGLSSERLVRDARVEGLIARYADDPDGLCEKFPELGGFSLPSILPAFTAVNKFDALHRRAVTEKWEALKGRVRDIYDLYRIANLPEHADMCRSNIEE